MDTDTKVNVKAGLSTQPPSRIESYRPLRDGEDGRFYQSWYPVCKSEEVDHGKASGFPFLDGRIAVIRDSSGRAQVLSGYCPHLGGDLGNGVVVDGRIQCPWHRFEFDTAGFCRKTGSGDPAPSVARLFAFPTEERYGLIWAFNGEKPLFDLPSFPAERKDLVFKTIRFVEFGMEPWLVNAQAIDITHFECLHGVTFHSPTPWETLKWHDWGYSMEIFADRRGAPFCTKTEVWGTNLMLSTSEQDGRWYGVMGAVGLPAPGQSLPYFVLVTERNGDDAEALKFLDEVEAANMELGSEDVLVTQTARFRLGALTKSDAPLQRYFTKYLKNFPRAHPAAGLLN